MQPDMRPALRERIKALEDELADYRRALERENARFGGASEVFGPANGGVSAHYKMSDLPGVIIEILKNESLEKPALIKKVSEIAPFNSLPAPGRNVHAQLNNLIRADILEKRGNKFVYTRE